MLRQLFAALVISLQLLTLALPTFAQERTTETPEVPASIEQGEDGDDPDLPPGSKLIIGKDRYRELRDEHVGLLRGADTMKPESRPNAIYEMMRQERKLAAARSERNIPAPFWRNIGPAPIPNGQTTGRTDPVSGRVSSIAVHPTNPNTLYVATAQGGLYRSLNGGTTWTPLLDDALTLAMGSVAISPSDPSTIFVGTGEPAFSQDAFFGVGVYRITNADTANPVVAGPFNRNAANADVFTGRSVSEVIIHPTDPNIIFVGTSSGVSGIGGQGGPQAPARGLYRTTNALSASPTFTRLDVPAGSTNIAIIDLIMEPGNPDRLIVAATDTFAGGTTSGVYLSTNATSASPTFTRTLTTGNGANEGRTELAINKIGTTVTVIAASGFQGGTVHRSVDGGATFTQTVDNNFCTPQCFYDIAVNIDPNDANRVYLAGAPAVPFAISTNGGTAFANSSTGLHVDSHAIGVAPSLPSTIYFGSDGGVWKSVDSGATWVSQNNNTLISMQYQSIAVHPTERNYTLGGTQDNGTQLLRAGGNGDWRLSRGGDGGFAVIDSNATSVATTQAYHTFFNATGSQIGFERSTTVNPTTGDISWSPLLGCSGGVSNNGIACADPVLFYAPMVLGPGTPNTVYFGTDKIYRSANLGVTMLAASQALGSTVSAIAVSKQNDNVRLVGTSAGTVWKTSDGSATLTNVTGPIPARYVGRTAIDPLNQNVGYVALNGYGLAAGQHIYKTTNLSAATPTWTASGVGIPDVPVNALAIDPVNSNNLYAGTDIGVYNSTDGGATWNPFGIGLPRVAVFGMEIQPTSRILRIATHGKSMYEIEINPLNAATNTRADFDGDGRTDLSVFRNGSWFVQRSFQGSVGVTWGAAGDTILPGDYDGDNKTDYAIYRQGGSGAETDLYVLNSQTNTVAGAAWGQAGDVPKTGDFNGDNRDDIAVYRPSTNTFFVLGLSGGSSFTASFGVAGGQPLVMDYDGDARTDLVIRSGSDWYIRRSSNSTVQFINWGVAADVPVQADYDNDNRDDVAVFRNGQWFVLPANGGTPITYTFGSTGDIPVPGDYDGDGDDETAVFRNGTWFIVDTNVTSGFSSTRFGLTGDTPVPFGYIQ